MPLRRLCTEMLEAHFTDGSTMTDDELAMLQFMLLTDDVDHYVTTPLCG